MNCQQVGIRQTAFARGSCTFLDKEGRLCGGQSVAAVRAAGELRGLATGTTHRAKALCARGKDCRYEKNVEMWREKKEFMEQECCRHPTARGIEELALAQSCRMPSPQGLR